jgi:hypothetical protein
MVNFYVTNTDVCFRMPFQKLENLRVTFNISTRLSYKCFRQFEDTKKGGVGWGGGVIGDCLRQAEIVAEFGGRYGLGSVYTFNKESTKESCTLSHAQLECVLVYMRVRTCARRKGITSSAEIQARKSTFSRHSCNYSRYAKRGSLLAHYRTRNDFTFVISFLPKIFSGLYLKTHFKLQWNMRNTLCVIR